MSRPVYIVDGARTPFLKVRGGPGPFTPVDLAVQCGRPLLLRQPFAPDAIDQVILGCVNVIADEANPARVAALRLGCGAQTSAFTVQINCGSGMQAMDTAYRYIADGGSDLILAGGTEALSHAPLVLRRDAVEWLAAMQGSKDGPLGKLKAAAGFRPDFLKPIVGLERGLTDPITDLGMGQTAEVLAHLFGISREQADAYAVESHQRLARAQAEGWLEGELVPAFARDGTVHDRDDGVRPDSAPGFIVNRILTPYLAEALILMDEGMVPETIDRAATGFGMPMANTAVAVLREKVSDDPDVIDAAMIFGTGFAPFRGGPIHYARQRGIDDVLAALSALEHEHGERFAPDAGWDALR